jgi:hypothetical protein
VAYDAQYIRVTAVFLVELGAEDFFPASKNAKNLGTEGVIYIIVLTRKHQASKCNNSTYMFFTFSGLCSS